MNPLGLLFLITISRELKGDNLALPRIAKKKKKTILAISYRIYPASQNITSPRHQIHYAKFIACYSSTVDLRGDPRLLVDCLIEIVLAETNGQDLF